MGAIIEIASGEAYEPYLRKHLFGPAGMASTGSSFSESERTRVARAYQADQEYLGFMNPVEIQSGPAWCSRASGAVLSTAEDMYKWHLGLRGSKILSAEAKEKMFTPYVPEQPERTSFYGYGWALFTTRRGTKLVAHNGSINDYFTADFRWYVDEGTAYFIAANTEEHSAIDVSREIAKVIFPPPKAPATR